MLAASRLLQSSFDRGPGGGRLGDPFEDRPELTFLKDWSEVSAPVQVLAALAQVPQVQAPQVPVPVERLPVPVPAARLLALVPGPELAQELAPEEASALVLGPEPGLQPSAALELARGPRPCAHT